MAGKINPDGFQDESGETNSISKAPINISERGDEFVIAVGDKTFQVNRAVLKTMKLDERGEFFGSINDAAKTPEL
jgi:hypothetical protein